MEPKKSLTSGSGSRPRIEDVLKPPTQIIVHTDNATLPRTSRKFPKPQPIQSQRNISLEAAVKVPSAHIRSTKEDPFVRWRSFNSGGKYLNTLQSPVGVNSLRTNGLEKLLSAEEQDREKVLSLSSKRRNKSPQSPVGVNGLRSNGLEQLLATEEWEKQKVLSLSSKSSNNKVSMGKTINISKNAEPSEGLYKAKPAVITDSDSPKSFEIKDTSEGVFKATPVITEDVVPVNVKTNGHMTSEKLQEPLANNAQVNDNSSQELQEPMEALNYVKNDRSEKDIQEAVSIILNAAKTTTTLTNSNNSNQNSNVPNSTLQLSLPNSAASVIVITINNNSSENPLVSQQTITSIETINTNNHNQDQLNTAADVTELKAKSATRKPLTAFEKELVEEIRNFKMEDLKADKYGQKLN